MTEHERKSTEARGDTGERHVQDSVKLSETIGEGNHDQETRPISRQLVESLRQSIAAGNYLTSMKIDTTVERLYRELLGKYQCATETATLTAATLFCCGL
jgi:anti-sigma28 factor (negative regulator of flagellin synthesis)